MENFDNFLLQQYSRDDNKLWTNGGSSSSSSSTSSYSQGDPCLFGQNLQRMLSQNRSSKSSAKNMTLMHRRQNFAQHLPTATIIRPKRKKSTEKERQRNLQIKNHLSILSTLLPGVKTGIPRIRTLRLANRYIVHLGRILSGEQIFCEQSQTWRLLSIEDFERTVSDEMQTHNSYKERAELEMMSTDGTEVPTTPTDSAHFPGVD